MPTASIPLPLCSRSIRFGPEDPEPEVLPTCRRLGIGFVPYSPLGRGFLTAIASPEDFEVDDYRRQSPRFQGENFALNLELVARVKAFAADIGVTAGQLALAWVLAKGDDWCRFLAMKRRKDLEENAAAVEITLSAAKVSELDSIFPPGATAGERYPPHMMALLNG